MDEKNLTEEELLKKLKEAISKMKLRSEEEMKIAEKELETMDSETLRKKFGF